MIGDLLRDAVVAFGLLTLGYFAASNTVSLVFAAIAAVELRRHRRRETRRDFSILQRSPATPGISIVVPAHNEEATLTDSVRSLLALDYPMYEVIVVNDGSSDGTLRVARDAFDLVRLDVAADQALPSQPVRAVYRSLVHTHLTVVDKGNGGKADSLNAGINLARHPLICVVDADSLLEEQALLRAVQPFIEDPTTVAAGGIVRVANNCVIRDGRVVLARLPRRILPLFQSVEYLRAFLAARIALSRLGALLIISGAFGLFRRELLIEVGGFRTDTVGEDMEIVTRLHRSCREAGRPYRIVFRADPVCWTQVPTTPGILANQRNRWQRGTLEVLSSHAAVLGNPRYGTVGLIATPYYLVFEGLAPVIECLGYAGTLAAVAVGALDWRYAELLFLTAVVYGTFVSVAAVLLQEVSRLRILSMGELAKLVLIAIVENFGYRQAMAWWRLRGTIDFLRGDGAWGVIQRAQFRRR